MDQRLMKNFMYLLIGFTIVLVFSIPFAHAQQEKAVDTISEQPQKELYAGKKAVGMFYNSYTGTKIAVCLDDIASCTIENVESNNYLAIANRTLRMFREPIYQFVDGVFNPRFKKLYIPSVVLY